MKKFQIAFSDSFKPEYEDQQTLATKLVFVEASDLVSAVERSRSYAPGLQPLYVASHGLDDNVTYGRTHFIFWDGVSDSGFMIKPTADYSYQLIEERNGECVASVVLATYSACRHMAQARLSMHLAWKRQQYPDFFQSIDSVLEKYDPLQDLEFEIQCFPRGTRVSDAKNFFAQVNS